MLCKGGAEDQDGADGPIVHIECDDWEISGAGGAPSRGLGTLQRPSAPGVSSLLEMTLQNLVPILMGSDQVRSDRPPTTVEEVWGIVGSGDLPISFEHAPLLLAATQVAIEAAAFADSPGISSQGSFSATMGSWKDIPGLSARCSTCQRICIVARVEWIEYFAFYQGEVADQDWKLLTSDAPPQEILSGISCEILLFLRRACSAACIQPSKLEGWGPEKAK